jgi:hypothetical protein
MPASSDSALLLAGRLRSLSDEALGELLSVREVRAAGIHDFFDLADALLDPDSVQAALARLDRSTLAALAALAEQGGTTSAALAASLSRPDTELTDAALATAERLALVVLADATATPTQGLVDAFAAWPDLGLPTLAQMTAEPAPPTLVAVSDTERATTDRLAAERAFETTSEVAELLAELEHTPARELSRGGIALPDSRRLAAAMNVELDRVAELLDIAERAGLVARDAGHWVATDAGASWRGSSSGHRWALLAGAWLDRLPRDIRRILADRSHSRWGDRLSDYTTWLFPAGGEWMADRIAVYTRDAALLGITADHAPSTPGSALLAAGSAAAAELMAGLFPPEVDKVYLQHDLTVVSPGPLAPPVDARLRGFADLENRGLASTYRVSAATLTLALASGETADGIRQFLSQISLTGIPQPLEYLLREAAARFGLVRVRATPDGRAGIHSTDPTLLRTLLVDQSLAALGLRTEGDSLTSRFDRDVVFWSLTEARYPVAAEDEHGRIVVPRRRRTTAPRPSTPDATTELIARLRLDSSEPADTQDAWLARQLDTAIRSKSAVTVTVRMPDGSTADYSLEPASVAGGRLRARDRAADLERTLPLSSIVSVSSDRA